MYSYQSAIISGEEKGETLNYKSILTNINDASSFFVDYVKYGITVKPASFVRHVPKNIVS